MRRTLTDTKWEIDSNTIIVGHVNIEWERLMERDLEISSRKLEIPREHFMRRWFQ